jgi:VIT1/CCC1 family predicted Fe2+/Mn2+ transporter
MRNAVPIGAGRFIKAAIGKNSSSKEILMEPKITKNLGMLLLGIWLILGGLIPLLNLSFSGLGTLLAILAIAAGGCILVGR